MSNWDDRPDYPLNSDLVKELKLALDADNEDSVADLLCSRVKHVDAIIELSNDDWMKDPTTQLPPGVLNFSKIGCLAMGSWPEPATGKLQIFRSLVFESHTALVHGDLDHLKLLMDQFQDANLVFEIHMDEMEWQVMSPATFGLSGLWTLEYKRELTTPLRIAAARGHTACVHHLLARGAQPNASPGGRSALHEACLGGHTACARLLLHHHSDPDLPSADALAPLHLCRTANSLGCAQALLEHGASVHLEGGAGGDTPLHVAAQWALDEHARLYLDHGAHVDTRNCHGETALSVACGAPWTLDEQERGLRLCALLLKRGADANARDEDERRPLHQACGRARPKLAHLLLLHGADAGALDYGGGTPLGRALQTAACASEPAPTRHTVQALLNHGAPWVWPDAFPKITSVAGHTPEKNPLIRAVMGVKVLKAWASAPAVIEVLFNSYPQLQVSRSWKGVIPEEELQMHQPFYQSLFALASTPRCLQHLCRSALRKLFGKKCFHLVPLLPLPKSLQDYLLLEPEGILH